MSNDSGMTSLISATVAPSFWGYCSVTSTGMCNASAARTCRWLMMMVLHPQPASYHALGRIYDCRHARDDLAKAFLHITDKKGGFRRNNLPQWFASHPAVVPMRFSCAAVDTLSVFTQIKVDTATHCCAFGAMVEIARPSRVAAAKGSTRTLVCCRSLCARWCIIVY